MIGDVQPSARPAPVARQKSGFEWVVDRIWRFFCSVRVGIYEITLLAVLVLIGALRNSSVPQALADAVPAAKPLVERWYAWDVYHSAVFMVTMTLLAIGIAIGGIINRAPGLWAAIAHPTVTTTHGFLRGADVSASAADAAAPADLAETVEGAFRGGRYRVLTAQVGEETHLYADRNRYGKLGTVPLHIALILVLVGGIVGARWGFRDTDVMVPEGSVRDIGHDTGLSVRLNRFDEDYNEDGSAKTYRSNLTVLKDGQPVRDASITVNHPLTLGDVVFYQSGFGQAVTLGIKDAQGNVLYQDALPLGEFRSKTNPDAPAALLDLPAAGISLTVIAPDDNPPNQPELDTLHLASGQMYLMVRPLGPDSPLKDPVAQVINQGDATTFGNATVTFERERRFTVLQVARNPAIPIFLASALMLTGGILMVFAFPHRRIRGIIGPDGTGGSRLALAPMAKRDWAGQRAFEEMVDKLEADLGLTMERTARAEPA